MIVSRATVIFLCKEDQINVLVFLQQFSAPPSCATNIFSQYFVKFKKRKFNKFPVHLPPEYEIVSPLTSWSVSKVQGASFVPLPLSTLLLKYILQVIMWMCTNGLFYKALHDMFDMCIEWIR